MKQARKGFEVLQEVISEENIEIMSQLIALQECKYLIGYIGSPIIEIRNKLYQDIQHKNHPCYALSDSYDLVQEVSLVLCQNIGNRLCDTHHIDKKGKIITIEIAAERAIGRLIRHKLSCGRRQVTLESVAEATEPTVELQEEIIEENYLVVDKIIQSLNLNELQQTALYCRMNGMSYPEIGRILERATSTVFEYFTKMRQRYKAIYR